MNISRRILFASPLAAALAKSEPRPGEMVPIPETRRRILLVWNAHYFSLGGERHIQCLLNGLAEMGFEGPAVPTFDHDAEDIRIFDLDGLPAPDTGLIQKLLAQAYDASTPRP